MKKGYKYVAHLYCLAVQAGFYSDAAGVGFLWGGSRVRSSARSGPDSSSGRVSASGAGGRRFETRPRHTKGVKNGNSGYLAWHSAL